MSFGLQYSPNVVVGDAAHVIGRCDRATIAAPVGDIAASICQFHRLSIGWKSYLVRPENKQRIELAFGVVEALGKKARFRPAHVRLFSHTIGEHHTAGECGLNDHFLPRAGTCIVDATYGFRHPLPALGEQGHCHPGARRAGSKFNANFRLTLDRESPVQSSSEIVDLDPKCPKPFGHIHRSAFPEQILEIESVTPAPAALLIAFGKSSRSKGVSGVE